MPDAPDTSGPGIEVTDLARVPGAGGVVWSAAPDGCHVNLVVLDPRQSVARHRNDALDVQVVVTAGSGTAHVDGRAIDLEALITLTVPRGAVRSIGAGDDGLRYLTVHAQRPPLTIGPTRAE